MLKRLTPLLALTLLIFTLGACQSTPKPVQAAVAQYYAGDFASSAATMAPLTQNKDEDFVLNNCRFGSAALAAGDLTGAENAFMAAYEVINGVNTNSGGRTMGATLVFEGIKVWKGEPFERAMAHYYLGLTCLVKDPPDYENARAAFHNSLFKLREYAKEAKDAKDKPEHEQYKEFETNFALGYFGAGYCYLRRGDTNNADQNFAEAIKLQPALAPVIEAVKKPTVNALIFVDAGKGPQRAGKGWYNEESAFGPTPAEAGPIAPAAVFVDGKQVTSAIRYDMLDTLAMAQDQKWQDIDTIRKVKAAIGTGAMVAGAGMTAYGAHRGDTGMALAGLGVTAFGALLAASSQADLRHWEMLPRTVYAIPLELPPGQEVTLTVTAGNQTSAPLKFTPPTKNPDGTGRQDRVLYFRLR